MSKSVVCLTAILGITLLSCGSSSKGRYTKGIEPLPGIAGSGSEGTGSDVDKDESSTNMVIPNVDPDSEDLEAGAGGLQPVFFNYDRYDIVADQIPVLERNATVLLSGSAFVNIQGHCDERGTEEYNLALGDRRARAVKDYLVSLGVDEERLRTISYGENEPFKNGHSEESWRENRRAHFVERRPLP